MGGIQSSEASGTNVKPALARDDRSPYARFGNLMDLTHQSFGQNTSYLIDHHLLLHPELYHLEIETHWALTRGPYWLFYRSADDRMTPEHMQPTFTSIPCLGFARSFMEIASKAGIDLEVFYEVACDAARTGSPMNIPSFVDACINPGVDADIDEVESGLRDALDYLKQCNDELDPNIALSFSHLDLIADFTKHIHACRRHAVPDFVRPTFSDVPEIAQYPHGDPVEIPIIYPCSPVFKDYLELGYGIERIAYTRLLTEISSHHIKRLSKSPELKHVLLAAFASAEICQAKLPFRTTRLPIDSLLGSLRSHAFLALAEMDESRLAHDKGRMHRCERRLNRCMRAIKHLIPHSPKHAKRCLVEVKEQIAFHRATQDILNVEKHLSAARLETSGMAPGSFRIKGRYHTETDGQTAIELAGARARNPHMDAQYALDVLHFVARKAFRENAPPALRAELIDAIQDIAKELQGSELAVHRARAGQIKAFLATNPFNMQ